MIRKLEKTDVDKVANLWLEANLTAHDFISEKYWKDHFNMVKEQLLQAEVYIYEDCQNISGFIGITDEYVEGIFVSEKMRSQGIGKQLLDFVKDKKKPKLKSILVISILAVLVMGIMQFIRGALREGTSVDWSAFDTSIFIDSIKGNCDIYKTFYGMAVTVPNELEYQYGMASIVSVITMIIPRKIWPGKPISPIITNLHMFCGELAAKSGYAMPNISEYYLDFGVIGCIVMLFIFGQVLQKLKDLYRYKSYDRHGLILYSVMFPALLQVMLRGYSPSYMYLLFFYSFPVIIMKYFVDNKSLK